MKNNRCIFRSYILIFSLLLMVMPVYTGGMEVAQRYANNVITFVSRNLGISLIALLFVSQAIALSEESDSEDEGPAYESTLSNYWILRNIFAKRS